MYFSNESPNSSVASNTEVYLEGAQELIWYFLSWSGILLADIVFCQVFSYLLFEDLVLRPSRDCCGSVTGAAPNEKHLHHKKNNPPAALSLKHIVHIS